MLLPVQSCFLLRTPGLRQVVHNLVVAEAGAELHLVKGCTTARYTDIGTHIGVTEYYVGENARVTSSMIHHWGVEWRSTRAPLHTWRRAGTSSPTTSP